MQGMILGLKDDHKLSLTTGDNEANAITSKQTAYKITARSLRLRFELKVPSKTLNVVAI